MLLNNARSASMSLALFSAKNAQQGTDGWIELLADEQKTASLVTA